MKKWFCNEEGATSVLIIFMMIVLVTLGVFAIVSAEVNIKFSQKAANWSEKYYALESQAEKYVSEVDAVLAIAEADAKTYVENRSDMSPEGMAEAFAIVYTERAGEELSALNAQYASSILGANTLQNNRIETTVMFGDAENAGYRFYAVLAVQVPPYTFSPGQAVRDGNAARYTVVAWLQSQTEQGYSAQEVWDGEMETLEDALVVVDEFVVEF